MTEIRNPRFSSLFLGIVFFVVVLVPLELACAFVLRRTATSTTRDRRFVVSVIVSMSHPNPKHAEKEVVGDITRTQMSRRELLAGSSSAAAAAAACSLPAIAAEDVRSTQEASPSLSVPFGAQWSAKDGLNTDKDSFIRFDMSAYKAMKDDSTRTPFFQQAIVNRLGSDPERQVVLDLGTGPYALFAILAAECGAGKVYAIEADVDVANSAKRVIQKAGYDDIITVLTGYSNQLTLPEKVDFVIAEIIGSIATEEGCYATIADAHRFVKQPTLDSSWIPQQVQTYAAPASYTLHTLFGPPEFDWDKLQGQPVRFNCRDPNLALLADPVCVEDIQFSKLTSPEALPPKKIFQHEWTFSVDPQRIQDNYPSMVNELKRDRKNSDAQATNVAKETSASFSGLAFWPVLTLDAATTVYSRSMPLGGYQKSHWQTVLPITSNRPIGNFKGGETIHVTTTFTLPITNLLESPSYRVEGVVDY